MINSNIFRLMIWPRFNISRSVNTTTCRFDSPKENEDETNNEASTSPSQNKPTADKLLSTLTGFKVMKNLGSKVGRSPRLRSAAADFRELSEKKPKERDGSSVDIKR